MMLTSALLILGMQAPDAGLQARIEEQLKDPILRGASVGILVADESGDPVFDFNSERRLIPASTQKVIATLYALWRLGPNHQPQTRFWRDKDSVTIDAPGDPTFTTALLREIRDKLGGQAEVVHLRQAYNPGTHPSWEVGDLPNRYAAPVSAFTLDRGSFEVRAKGGQVEPLPEELGVELLLTANERAARAQYNYWGSRVRVTGKPPAQDGLIEAFALREPHKAAARFLGRLYVPEFHTPTRTPDHIHVGPRMMDLAKRCLEPSDNLFAENLLLMGANRDGALPSEAPWTYASDQAEKFLQDVVRWQGPPAKVEDGSGLSRGNLVTARGLVDCLIWARSQPWAEEYRKALAEPGEGTLRTRLAGSSIHAKTGTLRRVTTLTGYVTDASGRLRVFAILVNNSGATALAQREWIDKIVGLIEGAKTP